jgi:hypothetical protein
MNHQPQDMTKMKQALHNFPPSPSPKAEIILCAGCGMKTTTSIGDPSFGLCSACDCRIRELESHSGRRPPVGNQPAQRVTIIYGFETLEALEDGRCPYCDSWAEGGTLSSEYGSIGGVLFCEFCHVQFTWIDYPFVCKAVFNYQE